MQELTYELNALNEYIAHCECMETLLRDKTYRCRLVAYKLGNVSEGGELALSSFEEYDEPNHFDVWKAGLEAACKEWRAYLEESRRFVCRKLSEEASK